MSLFCILIFVLSYIAIAFEHKLRIDKAASALVGSMLCWFIIIINDSSISALPAFLEGLGSTASILFFLMGAMTIVEIVDSHDGFMLLRSALRVRNLRSLIWITGVLTFFLSAVIDNLTASIVMATLCAGMVPQREHRWSVASLIIIAANAGGAWSPMGDVTTTMLWIGGNISAKNIILQLFLPSLLSAMVATWWIARTFTSVRLEPQQPTPNKKPSQTYLVLSLGLSSFLVVPIGAAVSSIPPVALMLFMLALLWLVTGLLHRSKDDEVRKRLSASTALQRIDTPSILFFMGILMSISALEHIGVLHALTESLAVYVNDLRSVAVALGLLSGFIDNIPLVAAARAMYPLHVIPTDHVFWELLAFTTGTGGSIMIIGSAAGVAMMGMEQIPFGWYAKRVAPLALLSMLVGIVSFLVQDALFH